MTRPSVRLVAAATISTLLAGPSVKTAPWTVSFRGAGPVRLGMSFKDVRRVLGDRNATLDSPESQELVDSCARVESARLPSGLGIMLVHGRVVRVDVYLPGITTEAGAEVGDSEARIRTLYAGHVTVRPHSYVPEPAHYLVVRGVGRDAGKSLLFETDHGHVTQYRAGLTEAVNYVEGCSG